MSSKPNSLKESIERFEAYHAELDKKRRAWNNPNPPVVLCLLDPDAEETLFPDSA